MTLSNRTVQFRPHANIRPSDTTMEVGERVDSRDVTRQECSPSSEVLHELQEPVEKYGRTNRFVLDCQYATGRSHELLTEKPEWAE